MREKELIYSNKPEILWDAYSENAIEEYQSCGISEPSENLVWGYIRDVDFYLWECESQRLKELFEYCDQWIIQCNKLINGEERYYWFEILKSWDEFKHLIINDSNVIEIYDDLDELIVYSFESDGTRFEYKVRKLNVFGQRKLELSKDKEFSFFHNLWIDFSVKAYFVRFKNGEDLTLKLLNGEEAILEVREHD